MDWRRTDAYQALVEPAGRLGITRVALPHKYPVGADPILGADHRPVVPDSESYDDVAYLAYRRVG